MENEKTVLIVEDEEVLRKSLVDEFIGAGFNVLQAENGEEGLTAALEKHPNLIILDALMPKMSGFDMARKLREDSWGKQVHIILLTQLSNLESIAEAMEGGVYSYLIKSEMKLDDVVREVKKQLGL